MPIFNFVFFMIYTFVGKLCLHDGHVCVGVRIANPHAGQIRFTRKRSTRRDTMTMPKKRIIRKATSQKPIDTVYAPQSFTRDWVNL